MATADPTLIDVHAGLTKVLWPGKWRKQRSSLLRSVRFRERGRLKSDSPLDRIKTHRNNFVTTANAEASYLLPTMVDYPVGTPHGRDATSGVVGL